MSDIINRLQQVTVTLTLLERDYLLCLLTDETPILKAKLEAATEFHDVTL